MARPKKPAAPDVDTLVQPSNPDEDLPTLSSLGLVQTPKGWVVYKLTTRGHDILDKELVSEPQAKTYAHEALKIAVVREFILPKNGQELL